MPTFDRAAAALIFCGAAALAPVAPALANATATPFVDPSFAEASDGFNDVISARVTPAQLVAGILGNVNLAAGSGGGVLRRTTGTAYPASYGIYEWSGTRSTFEYAVNNAIDGLSSVVMQSLINVSVSQGVDGLLETGNLPRLSYNGGTQFIAATTQVVQSVSAGFDMDGNPIVASADNPNYVTFTWDLSSVGTAVDSFKLTWATDAHSSALAYQFDQIGAVPEPQTLLMALMALGLVLVAVRRDGGFVRAR